MKLQRLAESARADAPSWDDARAGRVFAATLVGRERRAARARLARRSLGVLSSAAVVVVMLRAATSSAGASAADVSVQEQQRREATMLASHGDLFASSGDGGYGRD